MAAKKIKKRKLSPVIEKTIFKRRHFINAIVKTGNIKIAIKEKENNHQNNRQRQKISANDKKERKRKKILAC